MQLHLQRERFVRTKKVARLVATSFRNGLKKCTPRNIYHTLREDIRLSREAMKTRESELVGKPELINAKIRLKLAAGVAISEFAGTYVGAPVAGLLVQYATGDAYNGIAGTIAGDYFPAVASFQLAWFMFNKAYYSAGSFWENVKQFYKDVLPLHALALAASIPTYAITGGISFLLIGGINTFYPGLAHQLPMPVLTEFINVTVGEFIFLALVYSGSSEISKRLSPGYSAYLDRTYPESSKKLDSIYTEPTI